MPVVGLCCVCLDFEITETREREEIGYADVHDDHLKMDDTRRVLLAVLVILSVHIRHCHLMISIGKNNTYRAPVRFCTCIAFALIGSRRCPDQYKRLNVEFLIAAYTCTLFVCHAGRVLAFITCVIKFNLGQHFPHFYIYTCDRTSAMDVSSGHCNH